ncbi:protein ALP1-like [Rhagoletis pomonella]|uniref:protein ALP1-like n=1 Tax=Rhagoletis pomonella TaxID=28610 RepID=UPI00178154C3|nr:protein ALP1-like [Rhagoletis pomonella]
METIEVILIILMLLEARECFKRIYGVRSCWVRPALQNRDTHGFFSTHFGFTEEFKQAIRMEKPVFDLLLSLIRERISKNSNRPSIPPEFRLYLTLSYLAHGGSKPFYSCAFKIGLSTMKEIVGETCDVLWEILGPVYLSVPLKDEWKRIATDFYLMWDLPNCIGAIDGKQINIFCPSNSGSLFYNYKGTYSIVLLAVCDANYTFTGIDIGAYGSQSDGGILWNSGFGKLLYNGKLDLPENSILPDTDISFPHYFVGDNAFPLKSFLMRPYPGLYEYIIYTKLFPH